MEKVHLCNAHNENGLLLIPNIDSLTNAQWLMRHAEDVAYLEIFVALKKDGRIVEGTQRFDRFYTREDLQADIDEGHIIFAVGGEMP